MIEVLLNFIVSVAGVLTIGLGTMVIAIGAKLVLSGLGWVF